MTDHKWIKDIAQNLTNDLLSDFFGLWMKIDAQNLNLDTQDEDQIIWTPTATGIYSAKSAYELQLQGIGRSDRRSRKVSRNLGDLTNANSFCGYFYKIEFGQQISCFCLGGPIRTFALCAIETWRPLST